MTVTGRECVGCGWHSYCGRKTKKMRSWWRVCSTNRNGGTRRADIPTGRLHPRGRRDCQVWVHTCLSPLLSSSGHPERAKTWYFSSSREESTQTCPVKCVGSFISTDRSPLPEVIPVTLDPGNN
jgi:hypothetical protein